MIKGREGNPEKRPRGREKGRSLPLFIHAEDKRLALRIHELPP
jgi:hypothetical protein